MPPNPETPSTEASQLFWERLKNNSPPTTMPETPLAKLTSPRTLRSGTFLSPGRPAASSVAGLAVAKQRDPASHRGVSNSTWDGPLGKQYKLGSQEAKEVDEGTRFPYGVYKRGKELGFFKKPARNQMSAAQKAEATLNDLFASQDEKDYILADDVQRKYKLAPGDVDYADYTQGDEPGDGGYVAFPVAIPTPRMSPVLRKFVAGLSVVDVSGAAPVPDLVEDKQAENPAQADAGDNADKSADENKHDVEEVPSPGESVPGLGGLGGGGGGGASVPGIGGPGAIGGGGAGASGGGSGGQNVACTPVGGGLPDPGDANSAVNPAFPVAGQGNPGVPGAAVGPLTARVATVASATPAFEENMGFTEKRGDFFQNVQNRDESQGNLRPRFGMASAAAVMPSAEKQIMSDIRFDMFDTVDPGFGEGDDNKLFIMETNRASKIIHMDPLFTPGENIGPEAGVCVTSWKLQRQIPTEKLAAYSLEAKDRLASVAGLVSGKSRIESTNLLGDDYGYVREVSSKGLKRRFASPLEPIVQNEMVFKRTKLPSGHELHGYKFRREVDAMRYPDHNRVVYDTARGPTLNKRRSLEIILP